MKPTLVKDIHCINYIYLCTIIFDKVNKFYEDVNVKYEVETKSFYYEYKYNKGFSLLASLTANENSTENVLNIYDSLPVEIIKLICEFYEGVINGNYK